MDSVSRDGTAQLIVKVLLHQSKERQIPVGYRRLIVKQFKGDFEVNKHAIIINRAFALRGNPLEQMNKILDLVYDFNRRDDEEKARHVTVIRSKMLQWATYLQRTVSSEDYSTFIHSLNGGRPDEDV